MKNELNPKQMGERDLDQAVHELDERQGDGLSKAVAISVALHAAVFVAFAVRAVLYPSEPLVLENAVKVDIVALPDKPSAKLPPVVEEPAPAPPPKETAKPEPPKPAEAPQPVVKAPPPKPDVPAINLKKSRQEQEAALKRLEAIRKLESSMKSDTPAKPTTRPAPPIKGNEISKGASLTGLVRLDHQNYLQTVDAAVKTHWVLPQWMKGAEFSTRVRLFIGSDGKIVKKIITKPSGNPVYDEKVVAAIEAADIPAPPGDLTSIVAVDGIELEFVPN